MNFVQPIRDKEQLDGMKRFLKAKSERDYLMFMVGIYTGLRISDILTLTIENVSGEVIHLREQKTRKAKIIEINPQLKRALKPYIADKPKTQYLFQSPHGTHQPITRMTAYRALTEAARHVGLSSIGTHTMRKTFGYHYYEQTKDIALLQTIFNHASPAVTLRYIGINQDKMNRAFRNFKY